MTKNLGLLEYIGTDLNSVILNGVSIGIFITVGYGIYKTLYPSTHELNSDNSSSVDVGVGTDLVKTSDEMVQKSDQPDFITFGSELKKRLSQVKDIEEVREIYGDRLVDHILGTQIGEDIDYYSMCLELEKWKRFSELSIIYGIIKEDGTKIPLIWETNIQSSATVSEVSPTMSRSSSTLIDNTSSQLTSSFIPTRSSSPDVSFFSKLDIDFRKSLVLASDIASSDEGGYSDTSPNLSKPTTPTIPTSSVESMVDSTNIN